MCRSGTPSRPTPQPRSAPTSSRWEANRRRLAGPSSTKARALALGDLEAATGAGAAVLLALDAAAVAGQEATLLDGAAQGRLELDERLRDAMAHRAGLARQTAARHRGDHVELLATLRDVE